MTGRLATPGRSALRVAGLIALTCLASLVVSGPAVAAGLLLSDAPISVTGFTRTGPEFESAFPSAGGDINGDGVSDFVVAAPGSGAGPIVVYVVFGGQRLTGVDLSGADWRGFRIIGHEGLGARVRVATAGDVNSDGLADVLVGAPRATTGDRDEAGAAFVVYGKADAAPVELAGLGTRGVTLIGAQGSPRDGLSGDGLGASVAGAGDVNGDGRDDFVLTSPSASDPYPAEVHVVLGGALPSSIDMRSFEGLGWQMFNPESSLGAVGGAGDFNGDGLADVMVGEPRANLAGRVSVVFGSQAAEDVDLAAPGERGIRIEAAPDFSGPGGVPRATDLGLSLASAGDFNADGFSDVVVGAPGSYRGAGAAYVVYGRVGDADVDVASLGARGFEVQGILASRDDHGPDRTEALGREVVGDFDLNADGRPDLGLGAPWTRGAEERYDGRAYVLYGGPAYASMTTDTLPPSTVWIENPGTDQTGGVMAPVHDVTANGRDELLFLERGVLAAEPLPLRLRSHRRRLKEGAVQLPMACAPAEPACEGSLELTARVRIAEGVRRRAVIGRAAFDLGPGDTESIKVAISRRGRKTIRRRRHTAALLIARLGSLTQRESLDLRPAARDRR